MGFKRRLAQEDYDDEDRADDTEFDTFSVRITQPMQYEIEESLIRALIKRGAFNGIEDGREETHGPIYIEDFELRDPSDQQDMLDHRQHVASAAFDGISELIESDMPRQTTHADGKELALVDRRALSAQHGVVHPFVAGTEPHVVYAGGLLSAGLLAAVLGGTLRLRRIRYSAVAATDLLDYSTRDFA